MTLDLTLGNVITVALATLGALATLIKLLLAQHQRHTDKNFEAVAHRLDRIEATNKEEAGNWQRVERDLASLKADLPTHYVRREDYIRGQSVIESKLDALAVQIQNANLQAQLAAAKAKNP